jgi:hypothetical protein
MLQERPNVSQHRGEPRRRFFFDDYLQLYTWTDPQGRLVAFELAYDLWRDARAFRWQIERGMEHYRIDDGESRAFRKSVPILRPDRSHIDRRLRQEFLRRGVLLEPSVAAVVLWELDRFLIGFQ